MSASKYSEEFKQQVVLEVAEKSRTISEAANSYGLVPQTAGNWVNKWRKTHSGTDGEEMTAAQLAEYKKIKAELREARTGDRFRDKAVVFSPWWESQSRARYAYIHRQGRQLPDPFDVPLSGGITFRLLGLAQQGYVGNTQSAVEELAIFVTYFFNDSKQTHLEAYSQGVGEDESGDGLYCGFEGVVGAAVIGVQDTPDF
jgi:transposase IS3/IS911 family protein